MEQKPTITSTQWAFMFVGSALAFPYTFMPIMIAPPSNQDVWIVLILALVFMAIMNLPLLFLMNKFRNCTMHESANLILGKFWSKVPGTALLCVCLFCFIACTMATVIFIKFYLFTYTPTWAILFTIIIPVSYTAYKGAGTIGRLAAVMVPFITLITLFYFLFGLKEIDLTVFTPVLADSTFSQLMQGAFFTSARVSEILILFVFSYFLEETANINRTYLKAVLLFGACFFMILIPTVMMLGVDLARNSWSPYFFYTRQVKAYDFIERVQALNTLAWFPGTLAKVATYEYMACYTLSGMVKAKFHKPFVIPFSILAFIVCLLPIMNRSSTIDYLHSDAFFPYVIFPVTTLLPLIVVIVYFFRRKKINQILKQKQPSSSPSGS